MPEWSYDPGPNPNSDMGRELIDLTADIPNFPLISDKIIGRRQKFRPAFGPIPWRMVLRENKVKILFVGQDGTHIAEAAGRPATAGFGGRAQDFANYFGVNEGAAFINTYAFTIKGQYGVYNTPYFVENEEGEFSVRHSNLVDNDLWLISQDLNSPITQWRNDLIDWIIKNNKKSMKLIVLFGGAARDSIASYAKSKGAEVQGRHSDIASKIKVPITKEEYAGGNNTFPSLQSKTGGDLYEELLGRRLDYTRSSDQKAVADLLKNRLSEVLEKVAIPKGGEKGSGLINTAQLGGYDLDTMKVNGVQTRSLKGLKLNDGTVIENDIIVISLPHPSSLSRTVMDADSYREGMQAASERVMRDVRVLSRYRDAGWEIDADPGKVNYYARGDNYRYGRSDIGPEFYDFGTPANRMVSRSTARRMSRHANVVIIGTRDNGKFSGSQIKKMTEAKAGPGIDPNQMFIARPSVLEERYKFDSGPGEELAELMITNLNAREVFKKKTQLKCMEGRETVEVIESTNEEILKCDEGQEEVTREMNFKEDGIAAYNVKTHPDVDDFGHYRGTFKNPKVVIIADPLGYDDIVTAKALTGTRGQYLHDLMSDIGVGDQYLVLKTVPYGMDGATGEEWSEVMKATRTYREKLLKRVLKDANPDFIIADGTYAFQTAEAFSNGIEIIRTRRNKDDLKSDLKEVADKIREVEGYEDVRVRVQLANIPRSHLSFYSRVWEGTSGDRVITSAGKQYQGIAFAEVVPEWAYEHKVELVDKNADLIEDMIQVLRDANLPLPNESTRNYVERIN